MGVSLRRNHGLGPATFSSLPPRSPRTHSRIWFKGLRPCSDTQNGRVMAPRLGTVVSPAARWLRVWVSGKGTDVIALCAVLGTFQHMVSFCRELGGVRMGKQK